MSDSSHSFIGFWSPPEAGTHKLVMYFQAEEDYKPSSEMYLVYVHREAGLFRKDLSWTKLIHVNFE